MKKIKQYFCKTIETFIMLQFINCKSCGYCFFWILINHNHMSRVINEK